MTRPPLRLQPRLAAGARRGLAVLPRTSRSARCSTNRPAWRKSSAWPRWSRSPRRTSCAFVWMRATATTSRSARPPWRWVWLPRPARARRPQIPAAGDDGLVTLVYIGAVAMMGLPPRSGIVVVAVLAIAAALLPALVPGWEHENGRRARRGAGGVRQFGVIRLADRNDRLTAAQQRDRPAGGRRGAGPDRPRPARHPRPLADGDHGQGRAGRAAAALDRERAGAEVADVERLAREALADVRGTVGAYRG